jgi:small subunit ribosomal protein S6
VREYETVFILQPKLEDEEIEREIDSVKQLIAEGQGELVGVHKWGRKRMAYQIQRFSEGYYVITRFHGEPALLRELDRRFKLNEGILRHLTVLASGEPFPPEVRAGRERRGHRGEGPGRGGRRRGPADRPRGPEGSPPDEQTGAEAPTPAGESASEVEPVEAAEAVPKPLEQEPAPDSARAKAAPDVQVPADEPEN